MSEIKQTLGFDASQAIAELQKLDNAMANFEKRLQSTAAASSSFNTASQRIGKSFQNVSSQSFAASQAVQQNVGRMTTSLQLLSRIVFTQAVIRGFRLIEQNLTATANRAADLQAALGRIATIDTSNTSIAQLQEQVKDISSQFNIPLLTTAEGLYQTISNQIGDAAESTEFLAKAAQFAKATGSDLTNSVDLLSGAIKSYGLTAKDTDRVASIFFRTLDLGRVNADELANSFGRVGPLAKDSGISLEEVSAALSSITVRGSKVSEALTQVRAITTSLLKPSEAMSEALKKIGFESGDAALRQLGLAETLRRLRDSTGGSTSALAELFPNVRALAGVTTLAANNFRDLAVNTAAMTDAGDSATLAIEKFNQAVNNDGERVRQTFNAISNELTTGLGTALLKNANALVQFAGGVDNITKFIAVANEGILGAAVSLGTFAAALGTAKVAGVGLNRTLGLLSASFLAIGAGESLGGLLGDEINKRQTESLRALEAANAEELRSFTETQQAKIDAANKANQQIVEGAKRLAQQARQAGIGPDQVAAALDATAGVTALEGIFGRQITTLEQYAKALEVASAKVAELKQQQLTAAAATEQTTDLQAQIAETLQRVTDRERTNFGGDFSDGMRAQLQSLVALFQEVSRSSEITDAKLQELATFGQDFASQVEGGGLLGNAFATDLNLLSEALAKLQQLKALQGQSSADPALTAQLTKLEQVLAANPAGQFSSTTASMNAAVSPSQAIAAAWERAAAAAERAAAAALRAASTPKRKYFGGELYLADGGAARGMDSIPAMLSPGEFVVNAKSARNFASQLTAINAGQNPVFRDNGGSVTNVTIGDVNVNGGSTSQQTIDAIGRGLKREIRRGRLDL